MPKKNERETGLVTYGILVAKVEKNKKEFGKDCTVVAMLEN